MLRLHFFALAFLIYQLVPIGSSHGQQKDPLTGVATNLFISVEEYDPFKPSKGLVQCIVVNRSNNPVEVFLEYDGRRNQLRADSGEVKNHPGWELRLRPLTRKEELKRVRVKPGEELVVFELSLDEILLQGFGEGLRRIDQGQKWGWDWEAKPAPPPSPIHRWDSVNWRVKEFLEKAVFWALVELQGTELASEKVTLRIKPGTKKPK